MDYAHSTTTEAVRKSGKHLTLDARRQIQALHRERFSLRAIAARTGCSHTAIHYEFKRGRPNAKLLAGGFHNIRQGTSSGLTSSIERNPNDHIRLTAQPVRHSYVGCLKQSARTSGRSICALGLLGRTNGLTRRASHALRRFTICCGWAGFR